MNRDRLPRLLGACFALSALAVCAAHAAVPQPTFASQADYNVGTFAGPFSDENLMVAGDFRNTGRPDLMVVNYYVPGVTLMLNNGDGTFQSPGKQIASGLPVIGTLAVGDFNGDGNLDFIADSFSTMYVMLGDGKGNFTLKASYPIFQAAQTDIAVHDFNNDGILDVVVDTPTGVQAMLGKGDGTFTTGPFTSMLFPQGDTFTLASVAVANCNNDGIADLYVSIVDTDTVWALKGNGDGSFTPVGSGSTSIVPGSVYAGRFRQGAPTPDAGAVLAGTTPSLSMSYLKSDGQCGFLPTVAFNAGFGIDSASVGDFNRDGNLDDVSSATAQSTEVLLLGDGTGNFVGGPDLSVAPGVIFPQTPVVADFNGDGKPDIATINVNLVGLTTIAVMLNTTH
ncbi:MAG: VCBS repeat-containing protein [Nevskia sp.]|nr:VCBS repeat-containing protein [Nevskia sp.]